MSISKKPDPLDAVYSPERVAYALGALLGVEDFTDEQTYHRGRLARALAFLHGSGTVAGLRVDYVEPKNPDASRDDEEIVVHPGVAIDRLGRIIEVPRDACIRLDRWYKGQNAADLIEGFDDAVGGIVADVMMRFVACERGKTPAFATGPFDATDYAAPSRVRDGYELKLVIRPKGEAKLPEQQWPNLADEQNTETRTKNLRDAVLDAWAAPAHQRGQGALVPLAEHTAGSDTTAVFLARIVVPATAGDPPTRAAGEIKPDNYGRAFVFTAGALARWLDA
jgi:hypothetical protein